MEGDDRRRGAFASLPGAVKQDILASGLEDLLLPSIRRELKPLGREANRIKCDS